jgi:hypothetical protein
VVGRIFCLDAVAPEGRPGCGRPLPEHSPRIARLRTDARSCDGGLRQELAAVPDRRSAQLIMSILDTLRHRNLLQL